MIHILDFGVIKFVGVKYTASWVGWNAFIIYIGTWMLEFESKLESQLQSSINIIMLQALYHIFF
jgi:hypothetical protein